MYTEKKGDILLEDFYAADVQIYFSSPDLPLDSGFLALISSLPLTFWLICQTVQSLSDQNQTHPSLSTFSLRSGATIH